MDMEESFLSLHEFDEPSPMVEFYCKPITEEEYEDLGSTETEKAVKSLIEHLESHPEEYERLLQKRKLEEIEQNGLLAIIKSRFLARLQGNNYRGNQVTKEECQNKLEDLKTGMLMAYNYAQESKGRRYSRRLALKKARKARQQNLNNENLVPAYKTNDRRSKVKSPPPPPCPPPSLPSLPASPLFPSLFKIPATPGGQPTPLRERNMNVTCSTPDPDKTTLKKRKWTGSTTSIASIQEQITSGNPKQHLRSTQVKRSPGGTSLARRPMYSSTDSLDKTNPLNKSEPLTQAFLRILEAKFKNVRTPSPLNIFTSPGGGIQSPAEFSP